MTSTDKTRPEAKAGILDIKAYQPGKSKLADPSIVPVKLSSNENPLGSSPKALAVYQDAAARLNMYPDSRNTALRAAIAERYRLEPERLVFGCGSDELFAILNQVYLEPGDNIVMGQYGFSAYAIGARACQAEVRLADEPKLTTHVDNMLAKVDERTRLVFFANPSNPTGTILPDAEVRRLHAGLPKDVLLVIDGAYAEFCTAPDFTDSLDLARGAENIIVTRTFSKLHGLAGLRVGWGYGPEPVVAALDRIRLPFNVVVPGQEAAVAALADEDFQRRSLELVQTWLPWLTQQFGGLGLEVTPSHANFVLITFPKREGPKREGKGAAEAEAFLAERGLIVRGVAGYGLVDSLRISIGLEEHNRALVEALTDFLKA